MHIETRRRSLFGTILVWSSFFLHLITLTLYLKRPDIFAAFTVFPIWIWGVIGGAMAALAFLLFRAPFSLILCAIWVVTLLLKADEATSLLRIGKSSPQPRNEGQHVPEGVVRVATVNCSRMEVSSYELFEKWNPDILFLQEMPKPQHLKKLSELLHGNHGDYRYNSGSGCALLIRGKITRARKPGRSRGYHITAKLYNNTAIELVNLHLLAATTDLRLWRSECWKNHNLYRKYRRAELRTHLHLLRKDTPFPLRPTLIAGDFNAPAPDAIYRLLDEDFRNAFSEVGTGWGNTYHSRFPLLRIDHIYANFLFVPLSSRTVAIPGSDHLMVVADFKMLDTPSYP